MNHHTDRNTIMNLDDKPYLSGRAELMGTAIKPQPDGTTELELGFALEIPATDAPIEQPEHAK